MNFHESWACSSSRLGPGGCFEYRGRGGRRYRISSSQRPIHLAYSEKLVCDLTESDPLLRIIRNVKEGMYAITIAKTRN
jgi:hypothetical protein